MNHYPLPYEQDYEDPQLNWMDEQCLASWTMEYVPEEGITYHTSDELGQILCNHTPEEYNREWIFIPKGTEEIYRFQTVTEAKYFAEHKYGE